jgi:hypothetical protein
MNIASTGAVGGGAGAGGGEGEGEDPDPPHAVTTIANDSEISTLEIVMTPPLRNAGCNEVVRHAES